MELCSAGSEVVLGVESLKAGSVIWLPGLRVFTAKRFESVTQSSGEIYSCDAEIKKKKLINKYIKR